MASGWTPEPRDYAALHFLLIAVLVAIATAFDLVAHHITHRLDDGHDAGSRGKTFTERLDPMLWKRVQAEFTVLGFLALAIWISRHAGLLEAATAWAYSVHPQERTTLSHRRLGAAPSPSDAAPPVHGSLAECRGPVESLAAILPREQASLLHSLEDVHITLFVTMLCYFCGVRLAVGLVSGRLRTLAEIDADGADTSPAAASRSGGRGESSRARQLRRALSVGEGAPLAPQLADNMAREVEALVEFGTGAWLLILAYDLALLAAFALPCDDDLPSPWLRVFFLAPGVVVGLRLLAHAHHLRQQDGASAAADALWPCPMLERLSCACTGGTLGAYPCCGPPSSRAGLTFLQALLFFNIYVLVETATDSFTYSAIAGGGLWPRDPVALMQFANVLLWFTLLVPELLFVYALPPFKALPPPPTASARVACESWGAGGGLGQSRAISGDLEAWEEPAPPSPERARREGSQALLGREPRGRLEGSPQRPAASSQPPPGQQALEEDLLDEMRLALPSKSTLELRRLLGEASGDARAAIMAGQAAGF